MKRYFFYSKSDSTKEPIFSTVTTSRLKAATLFSTGKRLSLREFLKVFSVSR